MTILTRVPQSRKIKKLKKLKFMLKNDENITEKGFKEAQVGENLNKYARNQDL